MNKEEKLYNIDLSNCCNKSVRVEGGRGEYQMIDTMYAIGVIKNVQHIKQKLNH